MKKHTIISDLHIGSPFEIDMPEIIFNDETVFLGDNFDLKNTLNKELQYIKKKRDKIKRKVVDGKGIYLNGNHSLEKIDLNSCFVKKNSVLFLHGDIVELGLEKANKWRKSRWAGKTFAYWMFLKYWKKLTNICIVKKSIFEKASLLAKKKKCHTIVMGHFHPKKLIDKIHKEIRIVIVPRGKSEVWI